MASGVYGKQDVAATTWTEIVAAPASGIKVVTLSVANRTGSAINISVALRDAAANVTDADHLESGVSLPANGVLERTGIVLDTSNGLHVYAGATGISAVAYGMDG